jgi:hypothetical protein
MRKYGFGAERWVRMLCGIEYHYQRQAASEAAAPFVLQDQKIEEISDKKP